QQQWVAAQVRIIVQDGLDVGWVQTLFEDDALLLAQLFVDRRFQRRGIGTTVVKQLIAEADSQPIRLNVVKINPVVRLYQRLGFEITGEDDRKVYMRRQ